MTRSSVKADCRAAELSWVGQATKLTELPKKVELPGITELPRKAELPGMVELLGNGRVVE